MSGSILSNANAVQIVNDPSFTNVVASQGLTVGNLTYPTADGVAGQVVLTDGMGHLTLGSVAGVGNVVGSGVSIVNQVPLISNTTTTGIKPSVVSVDGFGNITTPGVVSSAGGNLVSATGTSVINQVPVFNNGTASAVQASLVTISPSGNISTPGVISSASGNLVIGAGTSVVNQVPIFTNTSSSAVAPSPVSINLLGNITTPGTITSAAGQLVAGGAASVPNQLPVISNATTSAVVPTPASVDPGTGNISTPGTVSASMMIVGGQPLVVGSGVSTPNQLPVISNATTSAVAPSLATVAPVSGNFMTPGTVQAGGVLYTNTDGTSGQVLTTNGSGVTSFQTVSGTGNVIGSGASAVNQLPVLNNTSTSAIAPSTVTVSPVSGNLSTPGTVSAGGAISTPAAVSAGSITTPGTLTAGNIVTAGSVTAGSVTTGGGPLVSGAGASVVGQLPTIADATTSSLQPSLASVAPVSGNITTPGTVTAGAVTYPKVDGVAGQVLTTNGAGVSSFQTVAGTGNVVGSGVSIVNQLPVISNTSTTGIAPSVATLNPGSGNFSTPGSVTAGTLASTGAITAAGAISTPGTITAGTLASTGAITAGGSISTPGTITAGTIVSGAGTLVAGGAVSTVHQVPVINNTTTSAVVPSAVTIVPLSGNVVTPGTITAASVTTTGGGPLTVGAVTYPATDGTVGQALVTNGAGVSSFQTVSGAGNVVGSGVSVVNQIPAVSNTSTTAIVPSVATVNPVSGNISTPGTITAASINSTGGGPLTVGAVTYPAVDGTAGQALVTDGAGNASFQTVGGGSGSSVKLLHYGSLWEGGQSSIVTADNRVLMAGNDCTNFIAGSQIRRFIQLYFNGTMTGDIVQLVQNETNAAVVTSTGQLWVIGNNDQGQQGNGDVINTQKRQRAFQLVPVPNPVAGLLSHRDIGTNIVYAAVCTNGSVYTWGRNNAGQCGLGVVTDPITSPTLVTLPEPVNILPSGLPNGSIGTVNVFSNSSTAVVGVTGKLMVWGTNSQGELGVGNNSPVTSPVAVAGITCKINGSSPSVYIGGENGNAMRIIKADGTTWAAGSNANGNLGDGTTVAKNVLVLSLGGDTDVDVLAWSNQQASGWISTSGILYTVGENGTGALGDGTIVNKTTRIVPAFAGQGLVKKFVTSGTGIPSVSWVICTDGSLWACGSDNQATLGLGTQGQGNVLAFTKVPVPNDKLVVDMQTCNYNVGYAHVLCSDGSLYSMGNGSWSTLGIEYVYGDYMPRLQQVLVMPPGGGGGGGSGNVSGSGASIVNQVPRISNASTTAIVPSSVTIDVLGNIVTPGTISASGGPVVSGGAVSSPNQVPVISNATTSAVVPTPVTINPISGNIATTGTISSGAGTLVAGGAASVANQVPVVSNATTSAIVPTPVTINPISGNISTTGTITSGAGSLVAGSGVSVAGQVPILSNTSTSAVAPSLLTVSPGTGNTATPGTLMLGALTYPKIDGTVGQVLTTDGAGNLSLQTAGGGNVSGSGVSVVNQVPRINDTATTTIVPSSVSIDNGGNIVTPGTVQMGPLIYTNVDGSPGDILTTDGAGNVTFGSPSGNVVGSGASIVNQVPILNNAVTTAIIATPLSIDPGTGDLSTPGTITSTGNIVTSGSIIAGTFISGSTFAKLMSYPPISTGGQQTLITNSNRVMRNGNSPSDANMLGASACRRFMDVIVDQTAGALTGVITQMCNNEYNLAFVTSTGQVWVGGNNSTNQLGVPAYTDTQYDHRRVRQVVGVPAMIAVYTHRDAQTNITYAAISATGTVYTWGYNGHGAVGDGTFVNRTSPFLVPMPGGATVNILPSGRPNFTAGTDNSITAFFAFVSTTGQLIVWGGNGSGQLGNGANADVLAPVVIAGVTCLTTGGINGDAPSVTGSLHDQRGYLRIIKSNGTTWASGSNNRGGLADGTTVDKNVFTQEIVGDTDVDRLMFTSTDLGGWISTGNQLRVCGNNSQGAIGNGTLTPATVMTRTIPTFAGQNNVRSAVGVSTSGVANIFALCYDGTVWCAGSDSNGQTAQGTVGQLNYMSFVKIQFPEPVEVFAMNVQPLTGGTLVVHFNCTNGTLWACGNASNGTLGIEYNYGDSMPSVQKVRLV